HRAADRGGLQHPVRAHRPHQGHALRAADRRLGRRRPERRPGRFHRRRRARGGAAPMIVATAGGFFRHLDAGKWADIGQATVDTLLMLAGSLPLTMAIGLPLGVLLFLTGSPQLRRRPLLYGVTALLVNVLRSVPFIILMIVLIPVTLAMMGTSLGVRGAIVPLVIGAAPFYARLVETALREVDRGVIEATDRKSVVQGRSESLGGSCVSVQ